MQKPLLAREPGSRSIARGCREDPPQIVGDHFSDMFDGGNEEEVFKALQHLKHNKHEVVLFHVTDHTTELAFQFDERPYEFVDLERGEKLLLNPQEIKDRYETQLSEYHQNLKMRCNQLKIDFISADINTGILMCCRLI